MLVLVVDDKYSERTNKIRNMSWNSEDFSMILISN